MRLNKYENIDLVIVNFYPFEKTLAKTKNHKIIIENIDIGGPTLVRAAAKNFKDVLIITGKKDYDALVDELRQHKGKTSLQFREYMASKAFSLTAYYDSMIAAWFNKKLNITFPDRKTIFGKKLTQLRYGENPHQNAAIY